MNTSITLFELISIAFTLVMVVGGAWVNMKMNVNSLKSEIAYLKKGEEETKSDIKFIKRSLEEIKLLIARNGGLDERT